MLSNYQLSNIQYVTDNEAEIDYTPDDSNQEREQAYEHAGVSKGTPFNLELGAAHYALTPAPAITSPWHDRLVRSRALSPAATPVERAKLARARTADMLAFAFSSLFSFDARLVAKPYPAPRPEPLGYDMLPELTLNPLLRPWEATIKDSQQGTQVHPHLALAIDIQLGFEQLSHTERLFVTHYYGFKRSYREIGQTTGRSDKWVRLVATTCLDKLAPYVVSLADLDKLASDAAKLKLELAAEGVAGSPADVKGVGAGKAAPDNAGSQAKQAVGNEDKSKDKKKKGKKGHTNLKLAGYEQGYSDLIADDERWWESDLDREVREAKAVGGQALTDSMRLESSLFMYLRQRPAQGEHGVSEAEFESELFFVKMPRGVERGFSREVLLSKLLEFARRGTAITEEIVTRLVDSEIESGLDAARFAREFGYNYGQVVQVKKDLLGRLISWMQDSDLPASFYTVRRATGAAIEHGNRSRRVVARAAVA